MDDASNVLGQEPAFCGSQAQLVYLKTLFQPLRSCLHLHVRGRMLHQDRFCLHEALSLQSSRRPEDKLSFLEWSSASWGCCPGMGVNLVPPSLIWWRCWEEFGPLVFRTQEKVQIFSPHVYNFALGSTANFAQLPEAQVVSIMWVHPDHLK